LREMISLVTFDASRVIPAVYPTICARLVRASPLSI
jgi:hypothetical protein